MIRHSGLPQLARFLPGTRRRISGTPRRDDSCQAGKGLTIRRKSGSSDKTWTSGDAELPLMSPRQMASVDNDVTAFI